MRKDWAYGRAVMANFLLELFSEEIPARLQARAAADLERLITAKIGEAGLTFEEAESHYGPRRLTLMLRGVPEASSDTKEERKGPKVGAPEKAIEGFLRGAGLSDISQAQVQETKKGDVYVALIEKKGRPAAAILAEAVAETVQDFPWPKSQRWGDGELRWVRPLRRILMTLDGMVVPLIIENGSRSITSGALTETHRVLGHGEVQAADEVSYRRVLTEGHVCLSADERKDRILSVAKSLCSEAGLELVEDDGLLGEVAGLAEWPVPCLGRFDESFLALPDEVITAAMRGHQKYFSVRDPKTGRLAPRFVCVADIDGGEGMLKGYERVLTARLSDALFLYRNDLSKTLETHAKKLEGVTFFEGLGTIADKVERIAALARELAPAVGADPDKAERAARLAKADLASEMVYEFPELQGLMGRYYALAQGEEEAVADAIRDHYKPQGQSDDLPTNEIGVAVSLADKLDTLAAFWSIDQKPTGSRDPFALRRAALAVIVQILVNRSTYQLREIFCSVASIHEVQSYLPSDRRSEHLRESLRNYEFQSWQTWPKYHLPNLLTAVAQTDMPEVVSDRLVSCMQEAGSLLSFFHDRLTVYFRDQGYRHDRVTAALREGDDDFVLVEKRLKALSELLDTEEGENLTAAFKRAANILKAEGKKGDLPDRSPDPSIFAQDEERALHAALDNAEQNARSALEAEDFAQAMKALAAVRPVIDSYFEAVTVNAEDPQLRWNRLAQLLRFTGVVNLVAAFDRLEG
ncbi:MAG: glycine--tRNA ligase subunit beta [Parvularcula sp.]|nr:glycine--tRNA ligase subunit beta [Parvularcula sp.]